MDPLRIRHVAAMVQLATAAPTKPDLPELKKFRIKQGQVPRLSEKSNSVNAMKRTFTLLALLLIPPVALHAAESEPAGAKPAKKAWPEPVVVEPDYDGRLLPAPAGALILFDGRDTSAWKRWRFTGAPELVDVFPWKVENGHIEVVHKAGRIVTREPVITSGHLHIEWATPEKVKGNGQGRGNNGVFIEGFPEVQILDSHHNKTYPDGQAAALYGIRPPMVNASRGPGLWQSYDIHVQRAKLEKGKVTQPATITVYHNNVLVQDKVKVSGHLQAGTLNFQDRQPVRFRNIWFLPAK